MKINNTLTSLELVLIFEHKKTFLLNSPSQSQTAEKGQIVHGEGIDTMIRCLANNLSILKVEGLWGEHNANSTLAAILERNKNSQCKKVCKVMLVGEARTGKTSLVRSLNYLPFDENQSITNAIEISDFSQQSKQQINNDVEMKIFDFGGQEIFHFIHPLFQSSQQCIVILVVNQYTQSLARIKEQIDFLKNFHHTEILVVSTCFSDEENEDKLSEQAANEKSERRKIDREQLLTETEIQTLGISKSRFVRISNKEGMGIEGVVQAIKEMSKLQTIGWSLSGRGDCLREYLESRQAICPVIANFRGELIIGCDHDHKDTFRKDLMILEKSGWLFTFSQNAQNTDCDPPLSVIHKKLIVRLLQELFTIDMHHKQGVLPTTLLVNGLITENSFKKYFNRAYKQMSGNRPPKSEMGASWEIVANLISNFSICHRISKRETKRIIPCILFPSLLPTFAEVGGQGLWNSLKKERKKSVTRKLIISGNYGDKRKVMDFIFPRLMIKMWNTVVDVKLCCRDKFVLRGDGSPEEDFSQELRKLKNFMIVSRTGQEIILERFGECFGRMYELEEQFDRLFVDFRKCFCLILSSKQSKTKNFDIFLECSACAREIRSSVLCNLNNLDEVCEWVGDQQVCEGCNKKRRAVETIENLSELARVFYLLKKFGKSTKKVEEELGDFVNYPRNQITVADKEHRNFLKGKKLKHLKIQRKLQQISAKEAVFQCCFRAKKSEVMVSKYLNCRMIDYSATVERAIENEDSREYKLFEEFLLELKGNRCVYSSFAKSVEQFKSKIEASQVPEGNLSRNIVKFFAKFEKLKNGMSSNSNDLFSKELKKLLKAAEEITTTQGKVDSALAMMTKLCMLVSRANGLEIMKELRVQRNSLQPKKGAVFSEVALHSFEDIFVEDNTDLNHPKPVIVDLMNIFDGPVHFSPFLMQLYTRDDVRFGAEVSDRLLLFLQICYGVEELKNLGIVHRCLTLKNTVILARSKWVCLSASGFGLAIKCPTEEMVLAPDEHKGLCGAPVPPPELQDSSDPIKMDKFDVHSLGLILKELIDSFCITDYSGKEEKTEVMEFLKKVQKRMICKYSERMSIEEVIAVIEWILYSKNPLGIYKFKGTSLATASLWDLDSEDVQKSRFLAGKQKSIVFAGIGQGRRFSIEEMMEIRFIFTFTWKKSKRLQKYLGPFLGKEPKRTASEPLPSEQYERIIFLSKMLPGIPLEKMVLKRQLGIGCSGIVWLVEVDLDGQIFQLALKMIMNLMGVAIPNSGDKDIDQEFDILSNKNHKNIVQILSKFSAKPTPEMLENVGEYIRELLVEENPITGMSSPIPTRFFLIDYYPLSLEQKLQTLGRQLNWQEICRYSRDLLSASLFLFENCIVHRDVKLTNILVAEPGDYLVLADFGESIQTDENHFVYFDNLKAGNLQFSAPEVSKAVTNKNSRINFCGQYSWEIGCVIFWMIEGKFPFPVPETADPFAFTRTAEVKVTLLELVKKMIKVNPKERISIEDAWNEFQNILI